MKLNMQMQVNAKSFFNFFKFLAEDEFIEVASELIESGISEDGT